MSNSVVLTAVIPQVIKEDIVEVPEYLDNVYWKTVQIANVDDLLAEYE